MDGKIFQRRRGKEGSCTKTRRNQRIVLYVAFLFINYYQTVLHTSDSLSDESQMMLLQKETELKNCEEKLKVSEEERNKVSH